MHHASSAIACRKRGPGPAGRLDQASTSSKYGIRTGAPVASGARGATRATTNGATRAASIQGQTSWSMARYATAMVVRRGGRGRAYRTRHHVHPGVPRDFEAEFRITRSSHKSKTCHSRGFGAVIPVGSGRHSRGFGPSFPRSGNPPPSNDACGECRAFGRAAIRWMKMNRSTATGLHAPALGSALPFRDNRLSLPVPAARRRTDVPP